MPPLEGSSGMYMYICNILDLCVRGQSHPSWIEGVPHLEYSPGWQDQRGRAQGKICCGLLCNPYLSKQDLVHRCPGSQTTPVPSGDCSRTVNCLVTTSGTGVQEPQD